MNVLPQKGAFWGLRENPHLLPFVGSCVTRRSALPQHEVAIFETYHYYTCVAVVHLSSGQRLIRHEWEASLPDMGLSKSLRTKV